MKIIFRPLNGEKPQAFYGICETPVGKCLMADTDEGVCWLSFVNGTAGEALDELKQYWGNRNLTENTRWIQSLADRMFSGEGLQSGKFSVLAEGTPFQISMWKTLTTIPVGETISYAELAERAGVPKAVRAAGTAIGKNNVSYLIPCHRVVRSDGSTGNYRWGADVKKKLLAWEAENMP